MDAGAVIGLVVGVVIVERGAVVRGLVCVATVVTTGNDWVVREEVLR